MYALYQQKYSYERTQDHIQVDMQGAVVAVAAPYIFLSLLHIAIDAAMLSIYPYMLAVCAASHQEAWSILRHISRHTPYLEMPSMGRIRI